MPTDTTPRFTPLYDELQSIRAGDTVVQEGVWMVYDAKREKAVEGPYASESEALAQCTSRAAWAKTLPEGDVNA